MSFGGNRKMSNGNAKIPRNLGEGSTRESALLGPTVDMTTAVLIVISLGTKLRTVIKIKRMRIRRMHQASQI